MKRLSNSDSFGALMSMCPSTEEHSPRNNHVYSREFQSMLDGFDEDGCMEESGHVPEKKRRLSVDQVKALEKNFEVENKLEPERKVKLAQELGLQPRQVAVWFQNRRARWKTKQLERDYGLLKASYDSIKEKFESLQHDKEVLLKEIRELKSKLNEENTESNLSIKEEEEALASESNNPETEAHTSTTTAAPVASLAGSFPLDAQAVDLKDGSSDSDSSAIVNEDNSPNAASNTSPSGADAGFLRTHHNNRQFLISSYSSPTSSFALNCSSSSTPSITHFNLQSEFGEVLGRGAQKDNSSYQIQLVKMEEHSIFSEEACNLFSEDHAPSLHWYYPNQWT